MSNRINMGDYHVGLYCGERLWRASSWRRYGLFRRTRSGFSIGPVLFWQEVIPVYRVGILATSRRAADELAASLGLERRDYIAFTPASHPEGVRLRALVMTPRFHAELDRRAPGLERVYQTACRNAAMTGALS